MNPRVVAVSAAAAALIGVSACSSSSQPASSTSASAGTELTVFAAASLTDTFTELSHQFEAEHPGTTVTVNFAGSADLVSQLQQGAPADVLATADTSTMDTAVADGVMAGKPRPFATNSMEIATPPDNPAGVTSFASLAEKGTTVVVCAPQVPCGAATETVEKKTGVTLTPASEENSVTDVLGKVTSGEADAGVVYVTDVTGAGSAVTGVTIPAADNAVNTYPIGVVKDAPAAASEFVEFILGPTGQAALADAGFGAP